MSNLNAWYSYVVISSLAEKLSAVNLNYWLWLVHPLLLQFFIFCRGLLIYSPFFLYFWHVLRDHTRYFLYCPSQRQYTYLLTLLSFLFFLFKFQIIAHTIWYSSTYNPQHSDYICWLFRIKIIRMKDDWCGLRRVIRFSNVKKDVE